ncbi:hypothetical protein [Streptacidiphilus sp. EB103A]|uniref:hypothetical protein n=1 Tax=Streptacidiphilus sp. EB103A TaxID=3156275 RepID=UPI003519B868
MADALHRLRGILASQMTGAAIEQLLADVTAELRAVQPPQQSAIDQPIPYQLADKPLWTDTSTYAAHGRLCCACPLEIRSSDPDYVAQEMEQHLAEAHGRATTVTVAIDFHDALLSPLRRAMKGGR